MPNDNAVEVPAAPPPAEQEKMRGSARKRRPRFQVNRACLTVKQVTLTPESIACRCCGEEMVVIGEETSSVTERVPPLRGDDHATPDVRLQGLPSGRCHGTPYATLKGATNGTLTDTSAPTRIARSLSSTIAPCARQRFA